MNTNGIHKKHNAEDARLKARPMGHCPKTRLYVIASHHASFNLEAGAFISTDRGYADFASLHECDLIRAMHMYRTYGSRVTQE